MTPAAREAPLLSPLLTAPSSPCRTFHTSLSSPVALAPAHLAHPTLPAAGTGMGVTPAGNAASAPAGQSSPDPFTVHSREGQGWPGGQGDMGGGECEVGTVTPSGGCLEYGEQHGAEQSSRGAAEWMPRSFGKLRPALVHAFSPFVPRFHKRKVRCEYLVDSGHRHHQAVCPPSLATILSAWASYFAQPASAPSTS